MTAMRIKYGFVKAMMALTFLAAVLLWAPTHSMAAEQLSPLTPVTLQLKWYHQFQFAGYYAAIERGYYRDEGLVVTLKESRPGISVVEEVSQKRAQFGITDSEALVDFARGKPIVVLGAIFQHSPATLLTRTDARINSPRDLRRKNVMYIGPSVAEIRAMIMIEGVNDSEFKQQAHTWNVDDLIEGRTDAMAAYLTNEPYLMSQKGVPSNAMRPIRYGIDFYGDCLITSRLMAQSDPELVERFMRASFRGWEYAMAHTEEVVAIIHSKYNSKKSYSHLMFEAEAMRELILPRLVQIGSMNPKRWKHIANIFSQVGLVDQNLSLEGFMYVPEDQRTLQWLNQWAPYLAMLGAIVALSILVLLLFNRKLQKGIETRTAELDRNRKSLRQVLDLVPNMVYAKNSEGRFLLVNRAVADSLDTTVKKLTGQLHMDVHPDKEQVKRMLADDQIVLDTRVPKVSLEEAYTHADGSKHWHQTTRLPYISADTEEPAVLVLSVDITSRREADAALKKSEEELRNLNEELEERVTNRTRNLEEAKTELEASLEKLKQTQEDLILSEKLAALGGLVAGVAHEINTPLGIGVTASSFLEDKLTELNKKFETDELKKSDLEKFIRTGMESSNNILTNLNRAAELIKSFKQVAADQSSEMPRQFNLKFYVDEVLMSLRPKYKRTKLTIRNDCPSIDMFSYPGAFMQIITNLLINSLTHAFAENHEGNINIGATVQDGELVFSFSDDGAGIPPELMDKVFEPFYTSKRGKGGTGLGLHIVYNTVTQTLDGTIHFDSAPGKGTSYTITMPLVEKKPTSV